MQLTLMFAAIACVVIVVLGYALTSRPSPTADGYGGVRYPTVPVPDSIGVTRYYDAESDVLCWIFTKQLAGGGFDVTSSCLPRGQTDY